MNTLLPEDLNHVVRSLPKDVRGLLKATPGRYLAGGFIRSIIAGEPVQDIDLFTDSTPHCHSLAVKLADERKVKPYETENAFTIAARGQTPVQVIQRWVYDNPTDLCDSFDFSIARAVVWHSDDSWHSLCDEHYYADLAARRLRYMAPVRNEDAGGSFLRMQKFLRRGYKISLEECAKVVNRLMRGVRPGFAEMDDEMRSKVIAGVLRDVDPLNIVDGVPYDG
jgi:hypothetical protein